MQRECDVIVNDVEVMNDFEGSCATLGRRIVISQQHWPFRVEMVELGEEGSKSWHWSRLSQPALQDSTS